MPYTGSASRGNAIMCAALLALSFACSAPEPEARTDSTRLAGAAPAVSASADSQRAHVAQVVAAGGVVDSILPMAEMLRRFRSGLAPVDSLTNGAASRTGLVERWVHAVQERDTASLNAMVLDRREFAWLYFPTARVAQPPYEAPPALLWEQILSSSDAGAKHVLDRFGGQRLALVNLSCAKTEAEGPNRLSSDCRVTLTADGQPQPAMTLFGSILEHGGRFKFIGYANRL